MAIVRRVTTTTDRTAMGVRCVLASIALTITIRARKAISLAKVISRGRVVTSLVLAIIVKAVMGKEKVAISPVPATIVKEAINLAKAISPEKAGISREKAAISPVLATIAKVATNRERVAISSVKVVTTAVLVPLVTILMLSTA